jgi:hypothetical protein
MGQFYGAKTTLGFDSANERLLQLRRQQAARRSLEVRMDALVNQLARELSAAISQAVSQDARVEACREKAQAAGFDLRVTLEAVIGFVDRSAPAQGKALAARRSAQRAAFEMSANDRRFLKSLRISADETAEKEVE